jgi:hypothetical protein
MNEKEATAVTEIENTAKLLWESVADITIAACGVEVLRAIVTHVCKNSDALLDYCESIDLQRKKLREDIEKNS